MTEISRHVGRTSPLGVLADKLVRLGRGEDGAALVLTLALFFLMYLACCGVFAVSIAVRERIHLQNAADAAAYSAAVVQADTLSRIATINRAMSWTYAQMTRRQMDYVTYRWLKETVKHWKDDRDRAKDWANSLIHPTPAVCTLAPFLHLKNDHAFLIPQMPTITLYGARGTSVTTEAIISAQNIAFSTTHVGSGGSFFAGLGPSMTGQIYADRSAIRDMGKAIDKLKKDYKDKAESVVKAVLASNLEDASVSAQTVDTMYYCDIKKMTEYVKVLHNTADEEDRFLSFSGERVKSAFKKSGEVWFKRCSSPSSGFRRGYDWNGDKLKATWTWYSNQWHCETDPFTGEKHIGPIPCPSCKHKSHSRCSCKGFGIFHATVYGDNSESTSGCRDIYETPETYVAKPNKVDESYFGDDGSIVVGVARRNSNAWGHVLGMVEGIFKAFDPYIKWSVAFASAKAGYVTLKESSSGGDMPYHVDWQSGGWKSDAESWNLCQSDWDAMLIPVRMAPNDARNGSWSDSDDTVLADAVGGSWKSLTGSASMPNLAQLKAPEGLQGGGNIDWRGASHVMYH